MADRKFLIVGHRGLPERHVENSLSGFLDAKKSGIEAVELDIQFTKDRKIIVIHDYDLKRLCNVEGPSWDYTLDELKLLRLGNSGEQIPTLAEVLDAMGRFRIFIELKTVDNEGGLVNYGLEDALVEELAHRDASEYRFLSFNPLSLRTLKEKNRDFITGLNVSRETVDYFGDIDKEMLDRFSVDFVQPEVSMFIGGQLSGIVKAGVPVQPWTVNNADEAISCQRSGAVGVVTDVPLKLIEKLK